MHKMMVLYGHPTDPAHFEKYYREVHLPLASKLPGLRSSKVAFNPASFGPPSPFFCIWEGEFDDKAAMNAAMGSPLGREVGADTKNYATGTVQILHFSSENTELPA